MVVTNATFTVDILLPVNTNGASKGSLHWKYVSLLSTAPVEEGVLPSELTAVFNWLLNPVVFNAKFAVIDFKFDAVSIILV